VETNTADALQSEEHEIDVYTITINEVEELGLEDAVIIDDGSGSDFGSDCFEDEGDEGEDSDDEGDDDEDDQDDGDDEGDDDMNDFHKKNLITDNFKNVNRYKNSRRYFKKRQSCGFDFDDEDEDDFDDEFDDEDDEFDEFDSGLDPDEDFDDEDLEVEIDEIDAESDG